MPILLAALAALLPLLITPGLLFHYDIVPRIALLALIAAFAALRGRAVTDGISALLRRRSGRLLCAVAAAQFFWLSVCTAISAKPWVSLLGSNWRRMGLITMVALILCAVLVAADLALKPAGITLLLRATAVAAIPASLYGIFQYFDLDPLQSAAAYHAHAGDSVIVRPPGTMGHADYFAWWLAIALFCALGLAATATGAWRRIAGVAMLLCGVAILFTGTRSAMLAVVAGFGFLALSAGITFRGAHAAAALLLAAGLAGFYVSPAGARMRARVQWSLSEPTGGARPLLWRDSTRMIVDRPVTGFGLETFGAEFPRYQSTDLARLLPAFYQESPHNMAIDTVTSEGIPGLLLDLAWLAVGGYAAFRARGSKVAMTRTLAPVLASALVASSVAAIFSAAISGPLIATALVLAMLVALTPEDFVSGPQIRTGTVRAVAAPLSVALAAYGAMLIVSDYTLARFDRSPGPAAYAEVVRTALPGAGEDLYCSRRLAQFCGTFPECAAAMIDAATRAIRTADNPSNAWYNLAIMTATRNDPAAVEHALREAAALAPNWFKPHWTLATLLALTGHRPEARAEAKVAAFLDAGQDAEVVRTFRELSASAR